VHRRIEGEAWGIDLPCSTDSYETAMESRPVAPNREGFALAPFLRFGIIWPVRESTSLDPEIEEK